MLVYPLGKPREGFKLARNIISFLWEPEVLPRPLVPGLSVPVVHTVLKIPLLHYFYCLIVYLTKCFINHTICICDLWDYEKMFVCYRVFVTLYNCLQSINTRQGCIRMHNIVKGLNAIVFLMDHETHTRMLD